MLLIATLVCAGTLSAQLQFGADSLTSDIVAFRDSAWFTARGADGINALWRTDGTPETTVRISPADHSIDSFAEARYRLWYLAGGKLYVSDPFGTNPQVVASFPLGNVQLLGGRLIFYFTVSTGLTGQPLLWRSDGTSNGTFAVATLPDLIPTAWLASPDDKLFYFTLPSSEGEQLWVSDGTSTGTQQLGPGGLRNAGFVSTALFYPRGELVWATTGTPSETRPVLQAAFIGVVKDHLFTESNNLFCSVNAFNGGTECLQGSVPSMRDVISTSDGNHLFFASTSLEQPFVGITDGTLQGTHITSFPHAVTNPGAIVNGVGYVTVKSHDDKQQLWRTDGTAEGTVLVKEFSAWTEDTPDTLATVGNRVVFGADDGLHGLEPWASDGTAEGTQLLANLLEELTFTGRVTDSTTRLGLPFPEITVGDESQNLKNFRGDAEGNYTIEHLDPAGRYYRIASVPGTRYIPTQWPDRECFGTDCPRELGQLVQGEPGQTIEANFALRQSGKISGHVRNASGQPIAGMQVIAAERVSHATGGLIRISAITDANGRYETSGPIPPNMGLLVYTGQQHGYSSVIWPSTSCAAGCDESSEGTRIQVGVGETRSNVDFTVKPWGRVSGRVLDALTGGPASIAGTFSIIRASNRDSTMSMDPLRLTGSEYTIALADGQWRLLFEPQEASYQATFYPNVPCERVLSGCFPAGELITPVPGETLSGYDIIAQPLGARIEGRITAAGSGAPIAGISVRILTKGGVGVARVTTNNDGTYAAPPSLPAGDYIVQAVGDERWFGKYYGPGSATVIALAGREVKRNIDLQLERVSSVRGLIVDATTREPLIGVELSLTGTAGGHTNHRGRYELSQLRPGTYTFSATKSGWQTVTQTITITAAGTELTRNLTMQPACAANAPAVIEAPAAGGVATIAIGDTCTRCAFTPSTFIHVTRACGTGEVEYRVDPNLTGESREGTIILPGQVIVVRQTKR